MTDSDYSHNIGNLIRKIGDNRIYDIHEHGIDIEANHIYLFPEKDYVAGLGEPMGETGIEYTMASKFIYNLNILMRKSSDPILIHQKTCGGDWAEGMAIHDAIVCCPNYVTILNYSHARSMSSLTLQAADKRVMMKHSTFMFHMGSMAYEGTTKQFMTEATELEKSTKQMLDIYVNSMKNRGKYSKRSKKFIREWLVTQMDKKEEVYLDAEQAVRFGFADEVFGSNGKYDWSELVKY